MKKFKYVLVFILIILSIGCSKTTDRKEISELSKLKNEMLTNISSYSYTISYDTMVDDNKFTMNMECKNDLNNKIGYCYIDNYYYDIEKYINYNNKMYYYRNIHPDTKGTWITMNRYLNNNPNHTLNLIDSIININKENNIYTGIIPTNLKIATILSEVDSRINIDDLDNSVKNIPVEVSINDNGYIEKITTTYDKNNVSITFKDYNDIEKIEIPSDIK
jgi:hypothetical protein